MQRDNPARWQRFLPHLIGLTILAMLWLSVPLVGVAASPAPAAQTKLSGNCDPDIIQPSGAIYRFCVPPGWNGGGLFVYAHGYVWFNEPLAIPEDHICFGKQGGESCVDEIVNDFGLAFATTSYPTNGLAVLPAVDDVVSVVEVFSATHGAPSTVYLAGVSEGGLVTTLAIERHPELFDGGLAACGPIGSWQGQINYFGDFRVLFDYFFPSLLPSETLEFPEWLIEEWSHNNYFEEVIEPVLFDPDNRPALLQLLETSGAPYNADDEATMRLAVHDALAYNVMATNEVMEKLGGNPFDNSERLYSGSHDDETLNAKVARWEADPEALFTMQEYETSGRLSRPLVTLHTSQDQQVPQWHESLYREKVLATHSWMWHVDHPMPVDRYGHCNFDVQQEILPAFFTLLGMVADPPTPSLIYLPLVGTTTEHALHYRADTRSQRPSGTKAVQ